MMTYQSVYTHVSRVEVEEMCDSDFRRTGLCPGWKESFWITPDGTVYKM